jgi:hypothetical protein
LTEEGVMMNVIHIILLSLLLSSGAINQNESDSEKENAESEIEVTLSPFEIYFELLPEPLQMEIHDEGWYDDLKNCFQELISEIEMPVIFSDSTETATLPDSVSLSDDSMLFPGLKYCKEQS